MPISFARAQAKAQNFINQLGVEKNTFETYIAKNVLEQYGIEFKTLLEKYINQRQVVASGKLADSIIPEISEDGKTLKIMMLDYYDYPNEGVKGVRSSKNAPGSPYKYKNYGMDVEGRKSIKEYILSGRASVKNVKKPVGLERKKISDTKGKKSLIDMQVDTLVYLIKKYGIKRTDYFNDAFEQAFKNWEQDMADAFAEDIKLNLQLVKK